MNLPEIAVRRHVLTWMLSGLLVLFGVIAYKDIGVDRFPEIDFPMISVTTILPGATPEIIDSSITNVIETSVNAVPGIEHMHSRSAPGISIINVQFDNSKDVDVAFNEVQAKVSVILRDLPRDVEPPILAKVEFGSMPIIWLTLSGDRTLQQLNQYARNTIKKSLETIDGVGEVRLGGGRKRTIRVNLDLAKMAALRVAVPNLVRTFQAEHLSMPGGFLVDGEREDLIQLDLEYHHPQDLAKMIIAYPQNTESGLNSSQSAAPIRLGDIAEIEDGLADYRQLARFNGETTVGLAIVRIQGANTVAIVDEVERRLAEEIVPQLPPGMTIGVAHNDGVEIRGIVSVLKEHLFLGTLLTAFVVLLFLRNFRSTLIIAAAIPVSLLGAVAVMYFMGYTFNTMTLLALLLLIGIVVDDAIVVLENIFRHREEIDPGPRRAAVNGSNEVVFAVLAATLTLVSIFVPVIFMEGIIGRFFEAFAVVVTAGVLVSLFVSLTLTPMLCSRYLQIGQNKGRLSSWLGRGFDKLDDAYRWLLEHALKQRSLVVLVTLIIVLSSGFFFANIGKGFMPEEDEGRFQVTFKAPLGSSIEYTAAKLTELEAILSAQPSVDSYFSTIGSGLSRQVNQGNVLVRLKSWRDRTQSQTEVIADLGDSFASIPGVNAFPSPLPMIGGQRGEPLQFVLGGPELAKVAELAAQLQEKLKQYPEVGVPDLDLQLNLPQQSVVVDRDKARSLGILSSDIALSINVLASGFDIARYNDDPGDGQRYDIRLKAAEGELRENVDLARVWLRGASGEMVRMDNIVSLKDTLGAAVISRLNLRYAAYFYATPPGALGGAVEKILQTSEGLLPPGYSVRMIGQAEEFGKTMGYMAFAFITALLLVFMVLASQFNSFVQPLIVMVAQPLAIIGGVGALWLTGHSLNMFSMIGLVLLVGLVAKNSILLVDRTNQLREKGENVKDALIKACPQRMRPVLMTSLTVILAMIPAALSKGAGADVNSPLAVAVIGGMISSTLLTLVVVPVVYYIIEGRAERKMQRAAEK
ncbi:MAG: efflux RND transporter permease subunit [Xanthomonadales bacterium]|nr:efflux RND transporter permease subunit [Xanthomonadales bacterium]